MNTDNTDNKTAKLTQVKTVYARAAIVLLALNMGFTGYITYSMNKSHNTLFESMGNIPRGATPVASETLPDSNPQALLEDAPPVAPAASVSTRDRQEEVIDK
jgi:hypothetical protein